MWKRAVTTGNPPSARDSHTCSTWKNKIVVVGGEDLDDYYLSDVHILDTGAKALLSTSLYKGFMLFSSEIFYNVFLRYICMEGDEYFRAVIDTSSWSCYCCT